MWWWYCWCTDKNKIEIIRTSPLILNWMTLNEFSNNCSISNTVASMWNVSSPLHCGHKYFRHNLSIQITFYKLLAAKINHLSRACHMPRLHIFQYINLRLYSYMHHDPSYTNQINIYARSCWMCIILGLSVLFTQHKQIFDKNTHFQFHVWMGV